MQLLFAFIFYWLEKTFQFAALSFASPAAREIIISLEGVTKYINDDAFPPIT